MCGIVGIVGTTPVNQSIYDALTVLQHRGQDAAGICTIESNRFRLRKANGLVRDVFEAKHMQRLQGNVGIGHVRYPTAGSSSASEAQPFYVNSPFGITLAHNGNLTNANQVRQKLFEKDRRHVNTTSDSEVLLNVLAHEIDTVKGNVTAEDVFRAISNVHRTIRGAYAVAAMIIGHGMIAFRDPHGIRPLCLGKREVNGQLEYMVASESVALDAVGFDFVRDVAPGEAIYATFDGELYTKQCADNPALNPCIFEFVYFARPDSFIDKISVYSARVEMGKRLGERIKNDYSDLDIDVVIPIPETSCDIALQIAQAIDKPYRQGFVKTAMLAEPLSCRVSNNVRNRYAVNSMRFAQSLKIKTYYWWMILSCVALPQSRSLRWLVILGRRKSTSSLLPLRFASRTCMVLICQVPMS